jgi:ABC transporter related
MKQIFTYLKPYRGQMLLGVLLIAVSGVCSLLLPTIMSDILNQGVYRSDWDYILRCSAKMLVVTAISLGAVVAGTWFRTRVVSGFCADLRAAVFSRVNQMPFEEVSRIGTSALLTRSTHDVGTMAWVADMLSSNIITIPVLFFGGVALAFSKDPALALIILLALPIITVAMLIIGRKVEPLWKISDSYCDKQNDLVRERLHGIRVIRAFNREEQEQGKIADATRVMAEHIIEANVKMGLASPLAIALMNLVAVAIVFFGGSRMQSGVSSASGGDIFAMVQYVALVMNGIVMAAFALVMYPHAKVAAGRIGEVMAAKTVDDTPGEDITFAGDIRMEDVTFCYEGADAAAVSHVTLHIAPGEKAAIIGGTGSGKSTLVQLLMAFRQPTEGKIYYDGRDAATLNRRTIRQNISCVLQRAGIYSGTIRENIAMGRPDAAEEEIWQAAAVAQMTDYIKAQPKGLDHVLVQAGKNLSGGQKQRVSIARAVLKNAPIYLFDDSFSALDFMTEANLRRALAEKAAGKTQIVVTQRVTSAMNSDKIFVMDGGRLVDAGTHRELLERCGVYREIYLSQTGGDRR